MAYNVYSIPDVKSVFYQPDAGTANLLLLRRWAKWARSIVGPNCIALETMTIMDNVSRFKTVCIGGR